MRDVFDNWNIVKKDLHKKSTNPNIKEGCVYWLHIGQNVGCEVNGKGNGFARPVLVIKRIYIKNTPYNFFIGVPLTSKQYTGFLYHKITNKKPNNKATKVSAMLGQMRIFDAKRVINYHYKVDKKEFISVREKVLKLLSPSN